MGESRFPMLSGTHQASYATNSSHQNYFVLQSRPLLLNAIAMQQAYLQNVKRHCNPTACDSAVFRIADIGSSSGPNCLDNMQFMLDALTEHRTSSKNAEIQFFFCDLPSNDFNMLFQLQGEHFPQLMQSRLGQGVFGGAVAGTMYGRLFPASSLHLVFSSFSLHWLSQIPTSVLDPTAREWNKAKIWVDAPHGNAAAGKAYAQQWQNDMRAFLQARSEEMVPGGLMFLIILSRPNAFPPHQMQDGSCFENLELAWQQLVQEGEIDQADMDTFNLTIYLPTLDEVVCGVRSAPSLRIHSIDAIEEDASRSFWEQWSQSPSEWAARVSNFYKSLMWNATASHVGNAKCEAIFGRFQELVKTGLENLPSPDPYWEHPFRLCSIVQVFKTL